MSVISYIPDQPAAKVHASLQHSLTTMDDAHKCAVLWFGEIMGRRIFCYFGHSSINQYAIQELGFSKSRTDDFIRLARQLENLPAVREAVASGELGYTKAREIVSVATPDTQASWLEAAKGTRREMIREVKKAKRAAKKDPGQGELMLEALAALLETKELQGQKCPRGHFPNRPPVQIHVHKNAETSLLTVQSDAGERQLSRADSERIHCDATVCRPGSRNTTTIPPRMRREVLARDKHRCQAAGGSQSSGQPDDTLWILPSAMA